MTSKKYNLVQITHDLSLGGLQQVIINLCKAIDKSKFNVSVLCLQNVGEFTDEILDAGISIHSISRTKEVDYFAFLKVAKFLKEQKADIVHTHNTQPFIDGGLGAILAGVKIRIHTDHAREFPDKKRYMFFEWVMSNFFDKVVGVSEHTSNNLIKYEKISRKKIVTIPNGIDPAKFNIKYDKKKKREELNIEPKSFILGLCVRLSEQKGIAYLLDAFKSVLLELPNAVLVIAGDGPLKTELQAQCQRLSIQNSVKFIGVRFDIPELLNLFDIYVLPSIWEGMPMVLLEAMAAECPIISSDVGGISTMLTNGKSASLVPAKDPVKLASEIILVAKSPEIQEKYKNNAKREFDQNFSAQIMANRYEEYYKN